MTNDLTTTQSQALANVDPAVAAYLAELDKLNMKRNGVSAPEIGCMSTIKISESTKIPMGNYFKKTKNEAGEFVYEDLGRDLQLVILRKAHQYNYYDSVEQKTVMKTTEFGPGVSESLICTDNDNNIQFEGTAKEFKDWALKNHPKFVQNAQYPSSMFKYRTVLYVANPAETEPGTPKGVYRMYLSTANNDYLWAYEQEISGFPIRYITQFVPEAKDNGSVRYYVHKLSVVEELQALSLVEMIKLKQELDAFLNVLPTNLKVAKSDDPIDAIIQEAESADVSDVVRPTTIPVSQTVPQAAPQTMPAPTKTVDQAVADAEDVFGV